MKAQTPALPGRPVPAWSLCRQGLVAACVATLLAACGGSGDDDTEEDRRDDPQPAATSQMQAVLDEMAALGAKPVETLTTAQARAQPSVADAVRSLLVKQGRSTAPEAVGSVEDRTIPGPAGNPLAIRIYKPAGTGPFPSMLYIHGGGWVIATIDTYDASARALTNAAGAIVVSIEYRKGPENRYPAAHDDTYAGWQWLVANAVSIGGTQRQIAVVGESAGGNMAASIALRARDAGIQQPVHQGLVYPITDSTLDKPSHEQNRNAMPLSTASVAWFADRYLATPADGLDPRFAVLRAPDVRGVAPATVINADIDPLRSEGRYYVEKLRAAGVDAEWNLYGGVTHEFFGTGAVVDEGRQAVARMAERLKASYAAAR